MTTEQATTPKLPRAASREEWLHARRELLAKEKEFTRQRDALSAARRQLPMVKVEKPYTFDSPTGKKSLLDLFEGRRQLIVYHFMFEPEWDEGCPSCSFVADNYVGSIEHLKRQDITLMTVARAPLEKIEAFKERLGWTFPWVSSHGSDFNYDFNVTLDPSRGFTTYNYTDATKLVQEDKLPTAEGDYPGLSVFVRDGDDVYHTYSTYTRGLDILLNTYNYIDLTPFGRQEKHPMDWIDYHDKY